MVGVESSTLVSSGIDGIDDLLFGGFLRGGFYLVQGDPGSGKTTLGLQFLMKQVAAGERCLYVSLTESLADLRNAGTSHCWSLEGIELRDLSRSALGLEAQSNVSVFHPADTELADLIDAIKVEVDTLRPQHIVFDGLSELRLLAGEALRYRRTLLALKEMFAALRITAVLLDDRSAAFDNVQPETLVGGNLVLERFTPAYGPARRRVHVTKVRGAQFQGGYHDYEIRTGGVVVYPRLVAARHRLTFDSEVYSSGVPNLDKMLRGGLTAGSTTLLLGPPGVGKSTTAMQFVVSALRNGKKAAVYSFDEGRQTLVERSEKLCSAEEGGIESFVAAGRLHLQQLDPAEKSPGAFANDVRQAVAGGARVIVIDSLNGYLNAMPDERFLGAHLHELFAYTNQHGVLMIVVCAQHGMLAHANTGGIDFSYLADSVLLFRYYEAAGEVNQAISVFKKRTGPHERTICRLVIDESGFTVGDPLREFRGLLTGVPQYVGASDGPPAEHLASVGS